MTQIISGKTVGPAIRYPNKKKLVLVLIAALCLAACTKTEKEDSPGLLLRGGQTATPQLQTGKLDVKIVPDLPTVLTELQVVYSGSGTAVYQWRKNRQPLEGENSSQLSKGRFSKGDTISVTVTSGGEQGEASVVIGNSPPTVISVPFSPELIYAGVDISVAPVGSDPDGDSVGFSYHWTINGKDVQEDTPVLNRSLFKRGDKINLIVIPYDREDRGKPFVSQNLIVPNGPPRIVSEPPALHGGAYAYQVIAEDPDGDPLTYSLASAPSGMSIDAGTGVIAWKLDEKSTGVHAIEIVAQDAGGMKATQKFTLTIDMTVGGTNEKQ